MNPATPHSANHPTTRGLTRRDFLGRTSAATGAGAAWLSLIGGSTAVAAAQDTPDERILGTAGVKTAERSKATWKPVSDRRIRVGIAGFGVCQFGAAFGFQDHPNVHVAAVTDLIPERRAGLARACRCEKTYESLEAMVDDDSLEAIFVATDAPRHARHCIAALKRGKHVACAVPAVFGSLDEAHALYEAVKSSGRTYMLFETSAFHHENHAMRTIYRAGGFGRMIYSEGEYYHYMAEPIPSFEDWRVGLPPQFYPTHSNAYHVSVTGGSFTEVSCMGLPSSIPHLQAANNRYKNPFGTEIALFRTSEGGMARMAVSWDTPGFEGEVGRVRGEKGSMSGMNFQGVHKALPALDLPPLPPGVAPGGHGGSHGQLMNEFVHAVLENRPPLIGIDQALNLTVSGIVAHQSAMKHGELLKIPQFARL
jgi:predicted dehydrogenase